MKRIFLIIFLAMGSSLVGASGSLTNWMATYYQTHDLSRFDEFWKAGVGRGALEASPFLREMMIGFLSQLFRAHPELMRDRIVTVDRFPEKQRDAVRLILWNADCDIAREILKKDGDEDMLKHRQLGIEFRLIRSPQDCAFCSGWFSATGDVNALRPMIEFIVGSDWSDGDLRLKEAALSLEEMARSDLKVRRLVEASMNDPQVGSKAKAVLRSIVYDKWPNQALEPTRPAVTPFADAKVAPAGRVAHL